MRKFVTLSMIAASALIVSACGQSETANSSDANAMVTEMNTADAMEGTMNDTMTNTDGAMGATDNAMMGDNMMMNDTMSSNTMSSNSTMTGNASNAM